MNRYHTISKDRESRFLLAAIVDSCEDAILSKSLDGTVTSWNGAATRMFGYTEQEIVGKSLLLLVPEGLYGEEDEILRRVKAGERIDHLETVRLTKDGRRLEISLTTSPIRDGAGRVIGSSKIMYDISERKMMQQSLIESEKFAATGRMAATIAHEINNPLESVMNLIYLARVHGDLDNPATEYLMTAEKEIERVSRIARQTLGYYRDNGSAARLFLHDLVQDVLKIFYPRMRALGIRVECRFDDPQLVEANRGELLQVLSNIIGNSIDAMASGGLLDIHVAKTHSPEAGVRVVICDQGIGIRQEDLPRVFEPFFTTKGERGTGIGLWVAKQLVERRHGKIAMTSRTQPGDSGTTTSLFIPFANHEASGAPVHATAA